MFLVEIHFLQFKKKIQDYLEMSQFYVKGTINVANITQQTAKVKIDKKDQLIIFSQQLSFNLEEIQSHKYLEFEVYMNNNQKIAQKALLLSNDYFYKEKHEKLQMIGLDNEIILSLTTQIKVDDPNYSQKIQQNLENQQSVTDFITKFHDQLNKMSSKKTDVINILHINQSNLEFINKITVMKNLNNYINDIYAWKDTVVTLTFGIATSIFIYQPRLCIVIALIIFYLKHSYILNIILQFKQHDDEQNFMNKNLNKIQEINGNMQYILGEQQKYFKIYDFVNNTINLDDKTNLIRYFKYIKRSVPFLLFILIINSTSQLILIVFWLSLIKNTQIGQILINFSYETIKEISNQLDGNLEIVKKFTESPLSKEQNDKITYKLYENQRWWFLLGWNNQMILNEMPNWSDEEGKCSLSFSHFKLPDSRWVWDQEWQYQVNEKTDQYGWKYATSFQSQFQNKNSNLTVVRQRQWYRSCSIWNQNY